LVAGKETRTEKEEMSANDSDKEIRWVEHGEETWQIFKSKLVGRLAAKECLLGLTMLRPEMAPPLAAAAVRRQREEEIRKYDEWVA
jgi:hypothetical protein